MLFVPSEVDVLGKLRTTSMLECNAQGEVLGPALEGEAPEDTLYKFKADEAKRFRSMAAGQLRPAAWCSVWNSFVRFWIRKVNLNGYTEPNTAEYQAVCREIKAVHQRDQHADIPPTLIRRKVELKLKYWDEDGGAPVAILKEALDYETFEDDESKWRTNPEQVRF